MSVHIDEFLAAKTMPVPKEHEYSISISFTGHDGSITIAKGKQILEVIEIERYVNGKSFDFSIRYWINVPTSHPSYTTNEKLDVLLRSLRDYIHRKFTDKFDYGIYVDEKYKDVYNTTDKFVFINYFNVEKWYKVPHHIAHAYGAFYQSTNQRALVITFDGGSNDGYLNCFLFDKNLDKPLHIFGDYNKTNIKNKKFNYGADYSRYGHLLKDIRYTRYNSFLSYPGKIMGLAGYGNIRSNLKDFLKIDLKRQLSDDELRLRLKISENLFNKTLQKNIKIRLKHSGPKEEYRFAGQKAFDLAASLQAAFEENFFENILPIVEKYKDWPVCYSGGCAMNIILNTKLIETWNKNIYVPPDPSDSGLSHGAMLSLLRPDTPNKTAYLGSRLLDLDLLPTYLFEEVGITDDFFVTSIADPKTISKHIADGKIIGVARGRSEIGPRALGNRSIICSVAIPDMKDIINAKVKNREWFRPFSPVVRLESVNKYFHWDKESPYMSFCPRVREEYVDKLKPIVHVDGTARVQTITREQNEFLYDLLGEVEKTTGYDMLLNTSFNVDSKPIVNSIKEVFNVLKTTRLDGVVIEDTLIIKKNQ